MHSMFDPLQVFASSRVGVRESEGSAEFFGGSLAVALFFEHLAQHIVRFESWALFHGRIQISPQQAHSHGVVATRAHAEGWRRPGAHQRGRPGWTPGCEAPSPFRRGGSRGTRNSANSNQARAPEWLASIAAPIFAFGARPHLSLWQRCGPAPSAPSAGLSGRSASACARALSLPPPTMPGAST